MRDMERLVQTACTFSISIEISTISIEISKGLVAIFDAMKIKIDGCKTRLINSKQTAGCRHPVADKGHFM